WSSWSACWSLSTPPGSVDEAAWGAGGSEGGVGVDAAPPPAGAAGGGGLAGGGVGPPVGGGDGGVGAGSGVAPAEAPPGRVGSGQSDSGAAAVGAAALPVPPVVAGGAAGAVACWRGALARSPPDLPFPDSQRTCHWPPRTSWTASSSGLGAAASMVACTACWKCSTMVLPSTSWTVA